MKSPRTRIYQILHALWCDIPADDNTFANNFIQAIATADPSKGYRPELLRATLKRVTAMLLHALPDKRESRAAVNRIANVVMMAFDGYVIGRHLNPRRDAITAPSICSSICSRRHKQSWRAKTCAADN